ncbi:MAG: hypothetical protein WBG37_11365 [Desulfobacterales bacterium]
MVDQWQESLTCATACSRCAGQLKGDDLRILSVYDHEPICMACKKKEERRPDYAEIAKGVMGDLMAQTELLYGDPGGYCYHHFYPFKCQA